MNRFFVFIAALLLGTPACAQMSVSYLYPDIGGEMIQIAVPSVGQNVAAVDGTTVLLINNSVLLATLTVTLPPNPTDGQRFMVSCNAGVTLLSVAGGTVRGALASIGLNGYARFFYSAPLNVWFRTG